MTHHRVRYSAEQVCIMNCTVGKSIARIQSISLWLTMLSADAHCYWRKFYSSCRAAAGRFALKYMIFGIAFAPVYRLIYRDDLDSHGGWTIITSQYGKLHGCCIVRGREDECREFYGREKSKVPMC